MVTDVHVRIRKNLSGLFTNNGLLMNAVGIV
jgi:hypothetical protein